LKAKGIEITLKAAGQKVGLAKVSLRLIRVKARATKSGVQVEFRYLPSNQFKMDLCLDAIQVLNCIPKSNQRKSPYEFFTNNTLDYTRDFCTEWGDTIITKKPKGIISDLNVTGQWAVVVQ
jgi:hypothetical protein